METVPPELPHSSEEEEEQKEDGKRKKKGKKVYTPADFKFAQPKLKRQSVLPVFCLRKWFRHYHQLVKLERNDPRPQQRAEIRAKDSPFILQNQRYYPFLDNPNYPFF